MHHICQAIFKFQPLAIPPHPHYAKPMKQLLLVTNPVRLTYLESLLTGAGIGFSVHDRHMANLLAGANSLFPMRLMVAAEDWQQAKRVLMEAEQFYDE